VRLPKLAKGLKPTLLTKLECSAPATQIQGTASRHPYMVRAAGRGPSLKGRHHRREADLPPASAPAVAASILGYKMISFVMPDKGLDRENLLLKAWRGTRHHPPQPVPEEVPRLHTAPPTASPAKSHSFPAQPVLQRRDPPLAPASGTTGPEEITGGNSRQDERGVGTISGIGSYLGPRNPNVWCGRRADPRHSITGDRARPISPEGMRRGLLCPAPSMVKVEGGREWVMVADHDSFGSPAASPT